MTIGEIIGGRYHIIRSLGSGGFGTTFLAEDRHLPGQPRCAVKQLKPLTSDPFTLQVARRLFQTEAEVLHKLGSHDQIPQILAHFEENGEFYLVQEYIEGSEFSQELPADKPLGKDRVIALLREILEILEFVHQQNVIHRDIKPANLIRRLKDKKLVLIDFGAVKQISTQVINAQGHTNFTVAIGSPGYMPNEQQAGKPRFSSDIYAVGMIGIQALTCSHPRQLPEDPNTGEIIWRDRAQAPADLADVLDKMVRYDFRDRYQSATEVLRAIAAINSSPKTLLQFSQIPQFRSLSREADDLSSERGVDYCRLRNLLAAGDWRNADLETNEILLQMCGRKAKGWLRKEDIEKLPCQDLITLDRLWVKYSQGRFGFSVQKRIWRSVGGAQDANYQTFCRFGSAIGWFVRGAWKNYSELTFTLDSPAGHLPGCFCRDAVAFGGVGVVWFVGFLFSRCETCKL